jgi:hypothetical protein
MWSALPPDASRHAPLWHAACETLLPSAAREWSRAMISDPIRLAFRPPGSAELPQPLDNGPALGPDEAIPIPGDITFDEFLQGLNPLHHLPGVGMIYRAATGAEINPIMRVLGAGIFGGPLGMALAGATAMVELTQPAERLRRALAGEPDLFGPRAPEPPRSVADAYRRWGQAEATATA